MHSLGLRTALRMSDRRSSQFLIELGQPFSFELAIAVFERLVLGVLDSYAQGSFQGIRFPSSLDRLNPRFDGQLCNLNMSLRAKYNAGARRSAQNSGNSFQSLFGLGTQALRN